MKSLIDTQQVSVVSSHMHTALKRNKHKIYLTHLTTATAHSPQWNGLCECFNQTLIIMVKWRKDTVYQS